MNITLAIRKNIQRQIKNTLQRKELRMKKNSWQNDFYPDRTIENLYWEMKRSFGYTLPILEIKTFDKQKKIDYNKIYFLEIW